MLISSSGMVTSANAQKGYRPIDVTNWKPENAASPMELVVPLLKSFPEALEGRPHLIVELVKGKDGKSFIIVIEKTGYLDDFLEGERYRAVVVPDGDKWRLKALGRQWKCYRGANKGWHTKKCH